MDGDHERDSEGLVMVRMGRMAHSQAPVITVRLSKILATKCNNIHSTLNGLEIEMVLDIELLPWTTLPTTAPTFIVNRLDKQLHGLRSFDQSILRSGYFIFHKCVGLWPWLLMEVPIKIDLLTLVSVF